MSFPGKHPPSPTPTGRPRRSTRPRPEEDALAAAADQREIKWGLLPEGLTVVPQSLPALMTT